MESKPSAGSKTLSFRSRAGADATIHLDIPVDAAGVDYNVVIVVQRAKEGRPQTPPSTFVLSAEVERDEDARWFGEIREVPGAFAYGQTRDEAISRATSIALRVLADRLEGVDESGIDDSDRDEEVD